MTNKLIHHSIPGQLPRYVNEEYPYFVEFLKAYYEWMETPSTPFYHLKNHLGYLDFKDSLTLYASLLKNEYLFSLPDNVLADKKLLIQHSKDFFQTLGTPKSFKFLFKILYGEDVEIYYPRDDILRASDGKWVQNETLMMVSSYNDVESFLFRRLKQTREVIPGVYNYAYATVNRVIKRYTNNFNFCELYLTDIDGEFDINYPVEVDQKYEWIIPISGDITITSEGTNYIKDNKFEYTGSNYFEITSRCTEDGIVDGKYTTIISAGDLYVEKNGSQLIGIQYNGKFITHNDLQIGDIVTIRYPVFPGLIVVDSVGDNGEVSSVRYVDSPFGIITNAVYTSSNGGSGASVVVSPSIVRSIPGYFLDNDGFLSDNKYLQDSDYYQEFSYVIKAGIDIQRYRDVVLSVLHPAGMKLFGQVNILELIQLIIKDVNLEITVKPISDEVIISDVSLWNRYGYIEDMKYRFSSDVYRIADFANVPVGNIFETPDNFFNVHDCTVELAGEILPTNSYVEPGYIENDYFE